MVDMGGRETKLHEIPDALRFFAELRKRKTAAACADLFKETVAKSGMHAFACGEIDLADRERNVIFVADWPKEWVRYYVKSGFIHRDPILRTLQERRCGFSFDDICRDLGFPNLDREFVRAAADHGWAGGMAAAVPRGGTRFGLVTLLGRDNEFDPSHYLPLSLISECLLARIRSLNAGVEYAAAPGGMSEREIEAARLVALGLSDDEIAAELGISPSTAHHHVESGRKRLHARNRAHMAALCVSLGIASAS
jgi:LuxR family transcriptional regulator, quorum-sensing system regulator BjaR1